MILDGYIAKWKTYPEDEIKVRVARPHILSPSKDLLWKYKNGEIDWDEYTDLFNEEISDDPDKWLKIQELAALSLDKDVRLICYEKNPPCHRFILIDHINYINSPEGQKEQKKYHDMLKSCRRVK